MNPHESALRLWSNLIPAAAAVALALSTMLLLAPAWGEAWDAIAWPLAAWFVVDTAFSAAHGVWGNVLLNTGTALMFAVPLWASRRHFAGNAVANPPPG